MIETLLAPQREIDAQSDVACSTCQRLIDRVHDTDYEGTQDLSLRVTFVLTNGMVLQGSLISSDHFNSLNSKDNGGAWPNGFGFSDADPTEYAHLAEVRIMAGLNSWTTIGTLRIPMKFVMCCGDRF